MLIRTIIIVCLIIIGGQISYALEVDTTVRGSRLDFQFRTSEIGNIVYQLNCMANITTGSTEAYKELWMTKLQWSKEDEQQLARWLQLWEKYGQSIDFIEHSDKTYRYPLNYPYSLESQDKLQLASLQAKDIEEYQHNLEFIVAAIDKNEFVRIVQHFQPRFHTWWLSEGKPQAEQTAITFATLVKEKSLVEFCEKVALFYEAQIPPKDVIFFNLMPRPKREAETTGNIHTNGSQVENQSIIEILKGEKPEDRIDVVLHELFHYFYGLAPTEKHFELLNSFLKADATNSMGLYSILDESLAVAIGNGLLTEKLIDKTRFEKYLAKDRSLYNDYFIDKAGKAIMRIVEHRIAEKRSLFDGFTPEYILAVTQALEENAQSPLLELKSRGIVYYGKDLSVLGKQFNRSVRGIQTSTASAEERWPFERYPDLGGIIILHSQDIKALALKETLLGKEVISKLPELTKKYQAFIYAFPRTAHSSIYLLVGDESKSLQEVISNFVKSNKHFEGVGYGITR